MVRRSLSLIGVLMLSFGFGICFGQSLQSQLTQKLHPSFQALVAMDVPTAVLNVMADGRGPSGLTKEGEPLYDAIITTTDADAVRGTGIHVNSVVGRFATALVTRQDLLKLVQLDEVEFLDPGSTNYPALDLSVPETGANLLHGGFVKNTPYTGKGVIVMIYDTGIDWRHFDFRDPLDTTKSRILAIWDQTISPGTGESFPGGFNYGVEYTRQQIEAEFGSNPPKLVRERDVAGHGTHVAGTAAGNGASYFKRYTGMAPEADIIVIKGGDGSFSESKMIDGLTYASNKASTFNNEPVVVNWSIGGHSGPHDGSRAYEVAVNDFVKSAGKVVTISAGNEGDELIHTDGTMSSGGSSSIMITVPTYTPTSGTDNDKFQLDVWFNSAITVTATVTSPSNITYSVNSTQGSGTASNEADGTIDIFNRTSTLNGNRNVQVYVHDRTANGPRAGTWNVTLSASSASAAFDGWLSSSTVGTSSVTIVNGNANKTVAMPGTADGAITVASYVTKWSWTASSGSGYIYDNSTNRTSDISTFSSIGPTADGRQKPDIAAPGQGISASLSSSMDVSTIATRIMPGLKDYLTQGTSMAAPHVAGAAALLLQVSRGLTAVQIKSLLSSTAVTDAYTGSVPNVRWGYGKMDVLKAAIKAINPQAVLQRQTLAYDNDGANQVLSPFLTGSTKYALRFTPGITGQLTGMQLNLTTTAQRPLQGAGPLNCEVWSNISGSVGGVPGSKLGSTVVQPFARLSVGTNNYIDMTSTGVTVTAGQDYHLVVSVANPQDTVKVRLDNVTPVANRSSYYDGSKWINLVASNSGASFQQNIRIRALVTSVSGLVSVSAQDVIPQRFELAQNYPNPFNPTTTIRYSVPVQGRVRLRVFDLVGREVASLVDEEGVAGSYLIDWRGTDNYGRPLASGVYFYKLDGLGQQITKKLILLK